MSITEPTSPTVWAYVRRVAHHGHYDRTILHAIFDRAYICHIIFTDKHDVHCIPITCWREGSHLYIRDSNDSRIFRSVSSGVQICVTVTHLDGLALTCSAFNHSINYRPVAIYGAFEAAPGAQESAMLDMLMEALAPGRLQQTRPDSAKKLAATTVLRAPLDEAACKVRTDGPGDNVEDPELPAWAGVLPMVLLPLPPAA